MIENIPVQLLIALLLGAAIGLERQSSFKNSNDMTGGGLRTFALTSLLGALAGLAYLQGLPLVFAFTALGFISLLTAHYILGSQATKDLGLTTEISFILTFLIGAVITTSLLPLQVIVALVIILILILSLKSRSHQLTSEVTRHELESFISYSIIALVILPFLPNTGYTLNDIPFLRSMLEAGNLDISQFSALELINPRKLWFIVVLVTGIDVLGYILSKFIGTKKGFTFTSFIAGFVSSTSTTQSLAQRSKKVSSVNYLVSAAVLANLASFFQIFLLVGPLNAGWLMFISPTLIFMMLSAALLAIFFARKKQEDVDKAQTKNKKIFSLVPAVKFAVLLIVVKIVTGLSLILFGESGFLISSVIASFAGLDAILVNLATMAGGVITWQFALLAFILVNATNLLSKTFYSFLQGSRPFAARFLASALIIILTSCLGLLFL